VDGRDISLIDEDQLFALGANVRPKINRWKSDEDRDLLEAEHSAYADLGVTHRRAVTFDRQKLCWKIEDLFTGSGEHLFELFFNFDAGIEVTIEGEGRALAMSEQAGLLVVCRSGHRMQAEMVERWVSLAYGERARSSGIIYRFQGTVPFENTTLLIPFRRGDEAKVERVMKEWE
jgi:hypothetical protein